jgi:formamidopyrimidine-DNA glycosylase
MPEGPEYRTDADYLDLYISNRDLLDVSFITTLFNEKTKGIENLQKQLPLRVDKVLSRGKKLFIKLIDPLKVKKDWWIYLTYGMTGKITTDKEKHSHLSFTFSPCWLGCEMYYYTNSRRIGNVEASDDINIYNYHINDIARPAVLGYNSTDFEVINRDDFNLNLSKCKKAYLASKLMDQRSIVSGIGNYLLSEIFYEAKLDPFIRCNDLSPKIVDILWNAINKVILFAYDNGGVSMKDYKHIDGTRGTHANYLKIYNRHGQRDENDKLIMSRKGPHGRTIWYI